MGPNGGKAIERLDNAPPAHYDVTASGCWEWNRSRDTNNYGRTRYGGIARAAHRAYYAHYIAPIPAGMVVMHLCDNPPCVNPDHLAAARQVANLGDMARRGRAAKGERVGTSKLTADQALAIYRRRMAGEPLRPIADDYGVSVMTVSKIARGVMWNHVTGAPTHAGTPRAHRGAPTS
jgi:hypothetical protein